MSEHQRETAFLRQLIAYDDTAERHMLEEGIAAIIGLMLTLRNWTRA